MTMCAKVKSTSARHRVRVVPAESRRRNTHYQPYLNHSLAPCHCSILIDCGNPLLTWFWALNFTPYIVPLSDHEKLIITVILAQSARH